MLTRDPHPLTSITLTRVQAKRSCFRRATGLFAAAILVAGIALMSTSTSEAQETAQSTQTIGEVLRFDSSIDELLPKDAQIEVLADGFEWSEGPVWIPANEKTGAPGYLLFSDIPNNRINKWQADEGISIFLEPSGYTGEPSFTGGEPGTNGLMLDAKGRLVMCAHGDRCIKRMGQDGSIEVLIKEYDGKRLNSPNDLAFHPSGALYFTDPPYGLPKQYDDPQRELDWCGVYRYSDGDLVLLTKEMTRPNGIAFSPNHKTLYVAQSDPKAALWRAFDVNADGRLENSRVFYDATDQVESLPGLPDGMCIDQAGNVWATGPGGVYVFNSAGKLLGRLSTGERTANCTFGDDGSTLYITADMYLCRVKTKTKGMGFK